MVGGDVWLRRTGRPGITELGRASDDPVLWSARRIGEAWLQSTPEEASRPRLAELLAPMPDAVRSAPDLGAPAVLEWLRARQRRDFAEGHVVKIEGWWLSRDEVRFCAYLALA